MTTEPDQKKNPKTLHFIFSNSSIEFEFNGKDFTVDWPKNQYAN